MHKISGRSGLLGVACALGLLATGCPNPNIYGTPRTVPKGKVAHIIAAEGIGYRLTRRAAYVSESEPRDISTAIPVLPSYQLRVGIVDRLDFGFRAANFSSLGLDLKINFLRTPSFDMSIDPMVQWAGLVTDTTHYHLPLLLGINLSDSFSIVATPGIMYATSGLDKNRDLAEIEQLMGTTGLSARFGLGFNARVSPKFAIQPELTFLRALNPPTDTEFENVTLFIFGVGFNIGNLPDFSDVNGAPPPAPPAAAPEPAPAAAAALPAATVPPAAPAPAQTQ
jgi:hypothetical protein